MVLMRRLLHDGHPPYFWNPCPDIQPPSHAAQLVDRMLPAYGLHPFTAGRTFDLGEKRYYREQHPLFILLKLKIN